MTIATDTDIDYTNRIIDLTGTTIYDVSVLYSYCKEQFKLSANIDDDFAWTANTPTDFTLKNGWYLRTHSIRRLKNGGIKTAYGLDEIEKITFSSVGTDPIESDIAIKKNPYSFKMYKKSKEEITLRAQLIQMNALLTLLEKQGDQDDLIKELRSSINDIDRLLKGEKSDDIL